MEWEAPCLDSNPFSAVHYEVCDQYMSLNSLCFILYLNCDNDSSSHMISLEEL